MEVPKTTHGVLELDTRTDVPGASGHRPAAPAESK